MDLRGIGWEAMGWMLLAQGKNNCVAVVNTVLTLLVP